MYNVKSSSKIVTKTTTRRGLSQKTYRDHNKNNELTYLPENNSIRISKPVFHGNKKHQNFSNIHQTLSPQHEELVKFVHGLWMSVFNDESVDNVSETGLVNNNFYYKEEPCSLNNFKPFDLESWWGKRLYEYLTEHDISDIHK